MNKRLKELREFLGLSMDKFGSRIGVTRSAISKMESGASKMSDQSIMSICREFNVNPSWLTEGQGEMFLNIPDTLIDEIALEYNLDSDERILVKEFVTLNPEHRKGVCTYIKNVVVAMNNHDK